MDREEAKHTIEAILFAMGDSVGLDAISAAIQTDWKEAMDLAEELMDECQKSNRGMTIIRLEDRYQMVTREKYYNSLQRVLEKPHRTKLSEPALEVLSIIAYKQPITRNEIEKIRGVSCEFVLNRLLEHELIEEVGRVQQTGTPILYGTTEGFLRHFGLSSLDELPGMDSVGSLEEEGMPLDIGSLGFEDEEEFIPEDEVF